MLIVETTTNSHIATVDNTGTVVGTVCKPAALPKKFTVVDSDDTYTVSKLDGSGTIEVHYSAVCNKCNKVNPYGR